MSSGWVRWMMEQYHFPFKVIFPSEINAGDLHKKYDVIVFVGPVTWQGTATSTTRQGQVPEEYKSMSVLFSRDTSVMQIQEFLKDGGNIVTIGSSASLAYSLKLPVLNALTQMSKDMVEEDLPREKYYIPGSLLRMDIDPKDPAAWGMSSQADVYFDQSPVFRIKPDAIVNGDVKPIGWFASETPLRSGWAWGQQYLKNGVAAFVAKSGKGKVYVFGPEMTFRAQTHGTFKFLFNQLYRMND